MRTLIKLQSTLVLSLGLSLSLGFTACTPKDQKLVRLDNKTSTNLKDTTLTVEAEDNYKPLLVLLDRQVEALHILKALLNPDYATKKSLKIETVDLGGRSVKKITSDTINLENEEVTQSYSVNLIADVNLAEDQTVQSIVINEADDKSIEERVKLKKDGTDLSLKNQSRKIIFQKSATVGKFDVTVKSIDETNQKSGKGLISGVSQFTMDWDGSTAALNEDVKLTNIFLKNNKYGVVTANFSLKAEMTNVLSVSLNENCSSLSGDLNLVSTLFNKKNQVPEKLTISLKDSNVEVVESKINIRTFDCLVRPIVDIRKLL